MACPLACTAQIRLMENGTFVHRESQAYRRKVLANGWLRRREHEMDQEHAFGQAPGRAQENFSGGATAGLCQCGQKRD